MASPSIVVTSTPGFSDDSGVTQERTGAPSTYTVHAPHSDMPQPYLVPVRLRLSRRIHRSGVSPGTLAAMSTRSLLTKMVGMAGSAGVTGARAAGAEGAILPVPRGGARRPGGGGRRRV